MIVVAGATGTLGSLLVPRLVAGSEPVRIISRNPDEATRKLPGVEVMAGDVCEPEAARRAVADARVVVSAITGFGSPAGVGAVDAAGNRTLIDAAVAAGVEQFVLLSVAQAAPDHPIELFRAKAAAERSLRETGMAWTIIRPCAYLETWLGLIGGPLVATGKTLVFGRGRNPINFVSALDVARVIDLAVTDPAWRNRAVEVPGPQNLTLEDLVRLSEVACGRSGRISHIPRAAMRILSLGLRPINRMRANQVATALVMDTRDMTADGPAVRAAYPSIPMTTADEVAKRLFGEDARRLPGGMPG